MADFKYAKYIVTDDLMPPLPDAITKKLEEQAEAGRTIDRTQLLGITKDILPDSTMYVGCEILWGLPGGEPVSTVIPHSHDFDEVLGYAGTNRNYPRELGGEVELTMDEEQYTITKTCLIFIPKGVAHCHTFKRIDTPIFSFTASAEPEYKKVF